jgi:hypothetical protein
MKKYKIKYWNPGSLLKTESDVFGCSVHGFTNHSEWINPDENALTSWSEELPGIVLTGDFEAVLGALRNLQFTPKACIAVVKNTTSVDPFIRRYAEFMPGIPLIGGGAAIATSQNEGELLPQSKEVSLLAIAEGNYVLESMNIYDKSGISVEVERVTDRIFSKLRILPDGKWQNAPDFYRDQQKNRGIEESNFELLTFFDNNERNIHCSIHGESIRSGANLPDDDILNFGTTSWVAAEQKLKEFISTKNSLIFGCAGIRSLIKNPLFTGENSLAGFMFGEIFTLNDTPMFGNLMLTKLIIADKG